MADLHADIKKAIEKNLPKEAGDLLRRRLEAVDGLEEALKLANTNVKTYKEENERLKDLELQEKILKDSDTLLKQRDAELKKKEQELEVEMLKKELEYVKSSRTEIKELVSSLFRNIDFRRTLMGSHPFQSQDGYVQNAPSSKSEDITAE